MLNSVHRHWENVKVDEEQLNINVLEMVPVWMALNRYASVWSNLHVVLYTDNTQVLCSLNKGTSSNPGCMTMSLLRHIFCICAYYNVHITARHISGDKNLFADALPGISDTNNVLSVNHLCLCCIGFTGHLINGFTRPGQSVV